MQTKKEWITVELNKNSGHNMVELLTNSSKFLQYYSKLLTEYNERKNYYIENGYKIIQDEPDKFMFVAEKTYDINENE